MWTTHLLSGKFSDTNQSHENLSKGEREKMEQLLGMWDERTEELIITRMAHNQTFRVREAAILSGSNKVFGVVTVGNEVHVLTGPYTNPQPNRRVKFNDSGTYRGTSPL